MKDCEILDPLTTVARNHYVVSRSFKWKEDMFMKGDLVQINDEEVGKLLIRYNYVR